MRSRRDFLLIWKSPRRDLPQMSTKPRNLKVSGLASPRFLQFCVAKRPNSNQAGLVRMKRQRELPQPFAHRVPEAPSIVLMLEAHDEVVGVSDHDHVARSLAPSPALGPEVEDVVEIDVRKKRARHSLNAKGNFRFERTIVD